MKKCYVDWRPQPRAQAQIAAAAQICADYQAMGFDLTLRQLYYQFVSRDLLPNTQRAYKNLGTVISKARDAGLLDWDFITDRGRNLRGITPYTDPAHFITSATTRLWHQDLWRDQETRVEVWVEKDALSDIVASACNPEDVHFFACKGYMSTSEMQDTAVRFLPHLVQGKDVTILHLGDHDPSGMNMSDDIVNRVIKRYGIKELAWAAWQAADEECDPAGLRERDEYKDVAVAKYEDMGTIHFERIALTMEQIERYEPPPNFAKETDSRYHEYVHNTGVTDSWELDALPPDVLRDIIVEHIEALRDEEKFQANVEVMEAHRAQLVRVAERWPAVTRMVEPDPVDAMAEEWWDVIGSWHDHH